MEQSGPALHVTQTHAMMPLPFCDSSCCEGTLDAMRLACGNRSLNRIGHTFDAELYD